jgi:hypothetical protein
MYTLNGVDRIIENILIQLLSNQNLLKCLKYDSTDALSQPDLTQSDIDILINQEGDTSKSRVFFTPFNLNPANDAKSELHLFIRRFKPDNIQLANVQILFQIIVNNQLWRLDNGQQRPLVMIEEILNSLQGVDIGFIGNLYFTNDISIIQYNPYFTGYEMMPNVRST